jgi:putative SOS response-associated peptidase YedK
MRMCGRFTLHSPKEFLAGRFDVDLSDLTDLAPRYNVAPTQDILAVRADDEGGRTPGLLRWGLVPYWTKDPAKLPLMINARAETVDKKPAYRDSFRSRRCLIPADGFYEWRSHGDARGPKTPYFISMRDREPFAMAGLWARWRPRDAGEPVLSCAIVTTVAHPALAGIHHRMPVVLPRAREADWLDPELDDAAAVRELLHARDEDAFETRIVSALVNSVEHDGPRLIEAAPDPAPALF